MSGTRLGLFDGRLLTLFPRQLLNTAKSPTLLVKDQHARLIENIIPNTNKSGSGAKRFGLAAKGVAVDGVTAVGDPYEHRKDDGTLQFLVHFSDGTLRVLDEGAGTYTTVKSGLNASGTLGALPFNDKLVFYNGIDPCFSWNGVSCVDLGEYVTDALADGTSFTHVSTSQITIKPNTGRAGSDYPNGRPIRVTFASGVRSATVASTSYNVGTGVLTINVTGTPFPAPTEAISKVEYYAKPPAFCFLFAELDRLWGLSPGELKAKVYRGPDRMKVFFQPATNNENSWFDYTGSTPTQDVPYINMTNKAKKADELVCISSMDGFMCFHGRSGLYIYAGEDPMTVGGFVWQKTIPVGTVHQKLVQRFPGDTLFFTPYGARSLRRVFQTEAAEVVADLGSDIDPTVQAKIATLFAGDTEYRKAASFYYDRDGLYGFKLDDESLLIYVLSEESKGWVLFTGHFADAKGFLGTTDGRLLVTRENRLCVYANGTDSGAGVLFSDLGAAIECKWWMPWVQGAGRWANKAFQILVEQTVSGTIYVDRYTDYNEQNIVTSEAVIVSQGAMWDAAQWDDDTWDGNTLNPVVSDKFLCDNFSLMVRHADTEGPRAILGIRPIGS